MLRLRNVRGFSLMELLIVIAIVGILAAVAYPSYTDSICKTNRRTAQADLLGLAQAMERYYSTNNFTYVSATVSATGAANTDVATNYSPRDGGAGSKKYTLEIVDPTATTYTLKATPENGSCSTDGFLELDASGARRWDKDDDDDATEAGEDSWS